MTQHKHELISVFPNTLDRDRERWTTSGNMKTFYDNVRDEMLKYKFVVPNPAYDPEAPLVKDGAESFANQEALWVQNLARDDG